MDYRVVKVSPRFEFISEHKTEEEAHAAWKEISWRDVDSAVTCYAIEESDS